MAQVASALHTYITYALLGSGLAYFLAILLVRALRVDEPITRTRLMYLCLGVPLVAYLLLHGLLPGLGLFKATTPGQASVRGIVGVACQLGYWGSKLLFPFLATVLGLVLARILLQALAVRQVVARYGWAPVERYPLLQDVLSSVCPRMGVAVPRVVVIPQIYWVCYTFGTLRPVLVMSEGALALLQGEELEAVVAHEAAHIRRRDAFTCSMAALLRDMMFFTPVAHWAYTALMREKEKAADDLAVKVTEKPVTYGSTLIKVWRQTCCGQPRRRPWQLVADPCFHFLWESGSISSRVARILEPPRKRRSLFRSQVMLLTILLVVTFALSFAC